MGRVRVRVRGRVRGIVGVGVGVGVGLVGRLGAKLRSCTWWSCAALFKAREAHTCE